jgi:hypothetical protein
MGTPTEPRSLRGPAQLASRMLRASLLRSELYEEVEADRGATGQAFVVVVLAAVATGIGAIGNSGPSGILWHTLVDVAGWYAWAWTTCWIGTRLLPTSATRADLGELLRTLGFASAPGVLRIGALQADVAFVLFAVCTLWMLIAMVVAVRQALDYRSTGRALAVCAIGLPVYALPQMLSVLVLGPWPL